MHIVVTHKGTHYAVTAFHGVVQGTCNGRTITHRVNSNNHWPIDSAGRASISEDAGSASVALNGQHAEGHVGYFRASANLHCHLSTRYSASLRH